MLTDKIILEGEKLLKRQHGTAIGLHTAFANIEKKGRYSNTEQIFHMKSSKTRFTKSSNDKRVFNRFS